MSIKKSFQKKMILYITDKLQIYRGLRRVHKFLEEEMSKTEYFVTLFNSRYVSRGLAMYESLKNVMRDFHLYIIAFDRQSYLKLSECGLDRATIISLEEFEDEELLRVKAERTAAEYCWTCSSISVLYIMERFGVTECTYIDADLYFFSDPSVLLEELTEEDCVLITAHRYSAYCDQSEASGKYCVQFVTFKNNKCGLQVLRWWTRKCIEWCYAITEEKRFGDQKYLDYFHDNFEGVHDLEHIGGGVAPWNVNQYSFDCRNEKIFVYEKASGVTMPLVFYHFQGLDVYNKDVVHLAGNVYQIPDTAITCVYKKYIRATEEVCRKYDLKDGLWKNEIMFRDDDLDRLDHRKNYYQYSLFL